MGLLVEEHNHTEAVVTVIVDMEIEDGARHVGILFEGGVLHTEAAETVLEAPEGARVVMVDLTIKGHMAIPVEGQHIGLAAEGGIDLILEGLRGEVVLFAWSAILKPSSRCANTHG